MPTFLESQLRFTFPPSWQVFAYDRHRFYQTLSGRGLVGADFMGFLPNGDLLIIEVKNYTDPYSDRQLARVPGFITEPERYLRRMARKLTDTLRSIRIFEQYLNRKWTYRLVRPYLSRLARFFPEWHRWTRAADLLDHPGCIHYVLWLETPETLGGYSVAELTRRKLLLERSLRQALLEEDTSVHVAWNQHRPDFLRELRVEFVPRVLSVS